ncbi:hypothetical protein HHI36_016700 [Cryptolaemus montrouzieri]|uniref:Crossover junction endonuclease MUS81 n=1 Tax=Cryptolaemus montrouzieri TaxID=559131 RepID=A0ABD2NKG1_9CUCU
MNKTDDEKRVTVKLQCPNPIFEKLLIEWRDEAKERNSKTQHAYSLALQSIRKYPLPLETGRDCKILKGFGTKLCEKLDAALKKYKDEDRMSCTITKSRTSKEIISKTNQKVAKAAQTKEKLSEYIPAYKSGSYAILLTLYKTSLESNYQGFMYKKDIIKAAQCICEKSFTKSEPGAFYTAWNSMKTLLSKNLVRKESNPAKFSLTSEGILLALKLYTATPSVYESRTIPSTDSVMKLDNNTGKEYDNKVPDLDIQMHNLKYSIPQATVMSSELKETNGGNIEPQEDPILCELLHLNVKYEVKNLKVGDYCWICRDRTSKDELVLPYVIERKRMDDLASSIKDGRFHEQKFRLNQCGLQNVIYMIETYGKNDEHVGLPLSSLYQATINTMIQDGFSVKFVEGTRGVAEYLSCMSNLLRKNYETKTIVSCSKENISRISICDDLVSLMFFREFNQLSSKAKNFTVKEMFIKQLLQLKGLSIEKALAIVEMYPTPQLLMSAFEESQTKNVNIISNIKYGKLGKKIGPLLGNIIHQLFTKMSFS